MPISFDLQVFCIYNKVNKSLKQEGTMDKDNKKRLMLMKEVLEKYSDDLVKPFVAVL